MNSKAFVMLLVSTLALGSALSAAPRYDGRLCGKITFVRANAGSNGDTATATNATLVSDKGVTYPPLYFQNDVGNIASLLAVALINNKEVCVDVDSDYGGCSDPGICHVTDASLSN